MTAPQDPELFDRADGPQPLGQLSELAIWEHELDAVDTALRRLDAGTYGTCEVCSIPLNGTTSPTGDAPGTSTAALLANRCESHAKS